MTIRALTLSLSVFALVFSAAEFVSADTVELVTGEQIHGEIVSVEGNKLTIESEEGKTQIIPFLDTVEIEFGEAKKPVVKAKPQPKPQAARTGLGMNGLIGRVLREGAKWLPVEGNSAPSVEAAAGGDTSAGDATPVPLDAYVEPALDGNQPQLIEPNDPFGGPGGDDDPFQDAEAGTPLQPELGPEQAATVDSDSPAALSKPAPSEPAPSQPTTTKPNRSEPQPSETELPVEPARTTVAARPVPEDEGSAVEATELKAAPRSPRKSGNAAQQKSQKNEGNQATEKPQSPQSWRVVTLAGGELSGELTAFGAEFVELSLGDEHLKLARIPRKFVRQLTYIPDEQLVANSPEHAGANDLVIAKVSDSRTTNVSGRIIGLEGESIKFVYQEQEKSISLKKIVRLELGLAKDDAVELNTSEWPIYHRAIIAEAISVPVRLEFADSSTIKMKSVWGEEISLPRKSHVRLETRNGRIAYLSGLPVSDVKQTAFFGRTIPWQRDKTLAGHSIELDGRIFRRGLSVHSKTELTYQLDGRYDQFQTYVGFDQQANPQGSVSLQVMLDGNVVYEKAAYRFGDDVEKLDIAIAGGKTLKLLVGFGEGQDVGDRVIWADARFVRAKEK